jgi:hypothetical protein
VGAASASRLTPAGRDRLNDAVISPDTTCLAAIIIIS